MELNEKMLLLQAIISSVKDVLNDCDVEEKKEILNSVIKNVMSEMGLNENDKEPCVQEGDIVTVSFAEYLNCFDCKVCPGINPLEQRKLFYTDFGETLAIHWMSALGIAIIGSRVDEEREVELQEYDCQTLREIYPDIEPGRYHIKVVKIEKTRDSQDVDPLLDYKIQQNKYRKPLEERQRLINIARIMNKKRMASQIQDYNQAIGKMHMDTIEAQYARTRSRFINTQKLRDAGVDLRYSSFSRDE